MKKQNFGKVFGRGTSCTMRFHQVNAIYRSSDQTGLIAAGNVKRTFDVKGNLCNTPCRSHSTSKQTRKSTKQTKSHSEREFWVWFVSITMRPACWRKQFLCLPPPTLLSPRHPKGFLGTCLHSPVNKCRKP